MNFLRIGIILFLGLCLVCGGSAIAEEEKSSDPEASTKKLRDPFWPIGYAPEPPKPKMVDSPDVPDVPAPKIDVEKIKWPELKVKGIIGGRLATIEGIKGVVEKGDIIRRTSNGVIFRWKIKNITERGIATRKLNAQPVK